MECVCLKKPHHFRLKTTLIPPQGGRHARLCSVAHPHECYRSGHAAAPLDQPLVLRRVPLIIVQMIGWVCYWIRILMYRDVSCMYRVCTLMCPRNRVLAYGPVTFPHSGVSRMSASVRLMIQGHSARRASSRVRQCHQLIKILEIKSEAYTSRYIKIHQDTSRYICICHFGYHRKCILPRDMYPSASPSGAFSAMTWQGRSLRSSGD